MHGRGCTCKSRGMCVKCGHTMNFRANHPVSKSPRLPILTTACTEPRAFVVQSAYQIQIRCILNRLFFIAEPLLQASDLHGSKQVTCRDRRGPCQGPCHHVPHFCPAYIPSGRRDARRSLQPHYCASPRVVSLTTTGLGTVRVTVLKRITKIEAHELQYAGNHA
jgi:hypothetical protein